MSLVPSLNHPTSGTANPVPLTDNDDAIRTVVNGLIDADNVTAASLTDACLTSPNNSTYKLLCPFSVMFSGTYAAGDYYATQQGHPLALGSSIISTYSAPQMFYRTANTVNGKTAYLRFIGTVMTNATSPAVTLTMGLNALTSCAGGAGVIVPTFNATEAVSSGISALTANMATVFSTSNLTDVAAANAYAVTFNLSGISAANSVILVTGGVYILHV